MKTLIAAVVLASASTVTLAAHGPAGCGLGTEVVFPNATEAHEHILAATTNGTSGNQTFGMTSGTLGCEDAGGPLGSVETQQFMNENLDQLAADVANGQGETLSALAEVIGVTAQDRVAFAGSLQSNFDAIFSANGTAASAIDAINATLSSSAVLKKYAA